MNNNDDMLIVTPYKARGIKMIINLIITLIITGAVMAGFGYLHFLDSLAISAIQKTPSNWLEKFYSLISIIGSPKVDIVWIFVIAFFLWGFKYKIPALWAIFTLGFGDIIGYVVKNAVRRARPPMHLKADDGFSFPSGHVLGSFLVIAILWIVVVPLMHKATWRVMTRLLMIIFMALVMASRVYLNAHYPSDTVGAAFVAYTWLMVSEMFYVGLAPKLKRIGFLKNSKV